MIERGDTSLQAIPRVLQRLPFREVGLVFDLPIDTRDPFLQSRRFRLPLIGSLSCRQNKPDDDNGSDDPLDDRFQVLAFAR